MNTIDYRQALDFYQRYQEIEARANSVCLGINTKYLKEKIAKMKDLLRGFSLFASQVSQAMTNIAGDIKQILNINKDITRKMN